MHIWLLPLIGLFSLGASMYLWLQAMKHLSPRGEQRRHILWMQGIGAGREDFTAEGWRYKRWAAIVLVIPFVAIFVYVWLDVALAFLRRAAT